MAVDVVDVAAYARHLRSLLPRGRAWPGARTSTLHRLLAALATPLSRLDRRIGALFRESIPWQSTELLPDWEAEYGLPDECSSLASTIHERRAAVLHRAVARENSSPATFLSIALSFGVTATVDEHDQARADAIPGLDVTNGRWRFVWWITIDTGADVRKFNTLSPVDMPLSIIERNLELECRLRKYAPAHTHLVIDYGALP